jgi:hypothetical protein
MTRKPASSAPPRVRRNAPQLVDALLLHGAVCALEARGFTRPQLVRLLQVEIDRLSRPPAPRPAPRRIVRQPANPRWRADAD